MSAARTGAIDPGFLTAAARPLLHGAKWASPSVWLSRWLPLLRPRTALSQTEFGDKRFCARRAIALEIYMCAWFFLEIVAAVVACNVHSPAWPLWVVRAIVTLRMLEILQVTVNASVFDASAGRSDSLVGSIPRMVVLAAVNFVELALGFGVIYASAISDLHGAGRPLTGFYFSAITQMRISAIVITWIGAS